MSHGPFISSDPRVVALLDVVSFPNLFDNSKVEKCNILDAVQHTLLSSLNIHKYEREKKSERKREGRKERTTPSRAPPPSPSSSSASERESSRMRGNAMEERKRREEGGLYRRLRALSRRCRRLELAAELLHRLQAVASPLISSLSLLNTIVFEGVYDFDSDDELQWLIEIQKRVLKLGLDWDTNEMSILMFAKLAKPLGTVGIVINSLHIKGKLFVRAIQELWQWWSRLLHVVVDTEEEEAVVEAVTTVGILGFCKELPNKLSLKNIEKVTRRAQEQFQMVLEEKSRFAFDVDLDAPKVRIPLRSRGSARCDSYFLLDFGHFTLHTAESQSDEQRHNLYSRFYISGRDFAAFFTDYGSDFGSCSLVKPTHDSQIISSPWAKEADNVYSVIDRCGMAVLVNQNHGNAEHIAKTMETCNQPTPDSLHSKLAPWSRDLVVDGRILVWKGIGNSVATWQTCFLVLSGSYLYVFETAESQSYQRYLRAWIIGSGNGEDRIAPLLVLSSSFKK
ncbi:Calcium-dependent lipid-binding-like protein [Arachis hypogaea]|nr:Calcium-dependent lipid-binding-like protein [Arachis hypogaea]